MFNHMTVRVSDHHASRRFYETVLAPLGHSISLSGGHFHEWNDFGVAQAREDRPLTRRPRAIYRGDEEERWDDIKPRVRPHADYVVGEIERLAADTERQGGAR